MYTFNDQYVSKVGLGISLKSEMRTFHRRLTKQLFHAWFDFYFFLQKLQNMQNNAPDANENILKKRVYEDLHK